MITAAKRTPKALVPAFYLTIDFGPVIGERHSSTQIAECYDTPEELVGTKVRRAPASSPSPRSVLSQARRPDTPHVVLFLLSLRADLLRERRLLPSRRCCRRAAAEPALSSPLRRLQVVNVDKMRLGRVYSTCLTLGVEAENGGTCLVRPDPRAKVGSRVF